MTANPALVPNGPNLDLPGKRQPEIRGRAALADVALLGRRRRDLRLPHREGRPRASTPRHPS
jgi:3-dehydroquinate dehydratase